MRIRPLSFIAAALVVALVLLVLLVRGEARPRPGSSIDCSSCDEWNRPREPFKIFGNTYYVGVAGLSSVLVASSAGLVVLDGALPQSAPLIAANIRKLGFRIEDVKLIVNSHAHYDHAGGIAALQALSGARVAASAPGAWALAHSHPTRDDPQFRSGHDPKVRFPRVTRVEVVRDGQALTVGDVTLTATSRRAIRRGRRHGRGARARARVVSTSSTPTA
jgi:metallo-beta-lactamase class B